MTRQLFVGRCELHKWNHIRSVGRNCPGHWRISRYGIPQCASIESLKAWPTLSMASSTEKFVWNLVDVEGQPVIWNHRPRLATDDLASLRTAAIQGVGVAMLPREQVGVDLQAGRLRHLLPELSAPPGLVHAILPTRRGMVPAVRRLLDALVAAFKDLNRAW